MHLCQPKDIQGNEVHQIQQQQQQFTTNLQNPVIGQRLIQHTEHCLCLPPQTGPARAVDEHDWQGVAGVLLVTHKLQEVTPGGPGGVDHSSLGLQAGRLSRDQAENTYLGQSLLT